MKTLTEELLVEYGFELGEEKNKHIIKTYSKNKFVVVEEQDGTFYYSYMGFEYPLKNEDDLQKIYFEVRREKLLINDLTLHP